MSCQVLNGVVNCTVLDHEAMIGQCKPIEVASVRLAPDGDITVDCYEDLGMGFDGTDILGTYGQSVDMDDTFACTSEEYGTVCWNKKTGDGFRLSRSSGLNTFSGGPANS